jgi:ribose/xylose/arabinose/galactoside ABC-type transport system permease subunit
MSVAAGKAYTAGGIGLSSAETLHKLSALSTLGILIGLFSFGNAAFLSVNNGLTILLQTSVIGLLGIGLTMVIITGRSRIRQALRMASRTTCPCSRSWLANSTIRMPFLAISPTSMTSPIWL